MLGPVQITRVRAFRQLQPFRRGNYAMGHVGSSQFDSTIVVLDTDEGVTGFGEMAVINAASYGNWDTRAGNSCDLRNGTTLEAAGAKALRMG